MNTMKVCLPTENRRVEVYMYASEQMIKNAEASN